MLLLDDATMLQFISGGHEFVNKVPNTLLLHHFLLRAERKENIHGFPLKKDTKFANIVGHYFGIEES